MYRVSREDAASEASVFGSRVVQQTFFRELVRHSCFDRCELLASPFDQPALQRSLDELRASGGSLRSVRVRSSSSLLADARWLDGLTAWHEVDERAQFASALRAARATRAFPITTTSHAFGYREQLHDLYTRMLLLDARPYDAHVCTSRAGAAAFRSMLAAVRDQLNATHRSELAYRGRIETIPLGVDVERFRPGDKQALRAELGWPARALVLLALGRLSFLDKADLFPLLAVFRELLRENPRRRLLLVLAGSSLAGADAMLASYCRDLGIARHVRILSPLAGAEREKLFAAADVFVSPADSIQEAFGQTPLEAMACGVPQVVSDWDGYRDTVVDGETGFLLPTYWARVDRDIATTPLLDWDLLDHAALAQALVVDVARMRGALQRLIEDEALRTRMAHASRERAVACFAWSAIIARYDALWLELAAQAAASKPRARPSPHYVQSPFFAAFRDYPTAVLGDRTQLRLTERGRAVLDGDAVLPAYFVSAAQLLDPQALIAALRRLQRAPATLGAVSRAIARDGWHADHARRHVLWHLKQGFAELARR